MKAIKNILENYELNKNILILIINYTNQIKIKINN